MEKHTNIYLKVEFLINYLNNKINLFMYFKKYVKAKSIS